MGPVPRAAAGLSEGDRAAMIRVAVVVLEKWSSAMKSALIGVIAVLLSVGTAAAQQDDARMPEGPNRELVIKTCNGCHALSNLYSTVGRTRDGWNRVLDDMTNYGMNVTTQERTQILEYLATALHP
jgi:cytochrome c5